MILIYSKQPSSRPRAWPGRSCSCTRRWTRSKEPRAPGSTTPASAACAARRTSPTTIPAPRPTACAPTTSSTCSTARPTATTGSSSARRRCTSRTTPTSCTATKLKYADILKPLPHQPGPRALRAAPRLGRRRDAQARHEPHLLAPHVLHRRGQLADPRGRRYDGRGQLWRVSGRPLHQLLRHADLLDHDGADLRPAGAALPCARL